MVSLNKAFHQEIIFFTQENFQLVFPSCKKVSKGVSLILSFFFEGSERGIISLYLYKLHFIKRILQLKKNCVPLIFGF